MAQTLIRWTPESLARFKVEYLKARDVAGVESFSFEGSEFLVSYAGYLIEYLTIRFNGEDR